MAECKVNCIWFIPTVSCERGAFSTETERSRIVNGLGFSENIPVCELCPLETYTDEIGSTTCLPCPKYHSTVSTGASSVSECLRKYMCSIYATLFYHIVMFNDLILYIYSTTSAVGMCCK